MIYHTPMNMCYEDTEQDRGLNSRKKAEKEKGQVPVNKLSGMAFWIKWLFFAQIIIATTQNVVHRSPLFTHLST